jgi:hypothetical protein
MSEICDSELGHLGTKCGTVGVEAPADNHKMRLWGVITMVLECS